MNPVWKLNFFLFNIEGYGEFFSGITPYKTFLKCLITLHNLWYIAEPMSVNCWTLFFYCRRKHRQVTGYNTHGDDDSDRDIYHAYNFSFQNKYDKN